MSISFAATKGSPTGKVNKIFYGIMNQWPWAWKADLRVPLQSEVYLALRPVMQMVRDHPLGHHDNPRFWRRVNDIDTIQDPLKRMLARALAKKTEKDA